jgi:hypothetical protein
VDGLLDEIVDRAERLDSGETAAGDNDCQQRLPLTGRAFRARVFNQRDQPVTELYGIAKCLEAHCRSLDTGQI